MFKVWKFSGSDPGIAYKTSSSSSRDLLPYTRLLLKAYFLRAILVESAPLHCFLVPNTLFSSYVIAVISHPAVVRPVSYSVSPSSLEQPTGGSLSPACKVAAGLDPSLGKSKGLPLLSDCIFMHTLLAARSTAWLSSTDELQQLHRQTHFGPNPIQL